MKVLRFLARNSTEAIAQIRARLGPEAVVLSVKRVPAQGLSRLWRQSQLEVRACLPQDTPVGGEKDEAEIAELPVLPHASGGGGEKARYERLDVLDEEIPGPPEPALGHRAKARPRSGGGNGPAPPSDDSLAEAATHHSAGEEAQGSASKAKRKPQTGAMVRKRSSAASRLSGKPGAGRGTQRQQRIASAESSLAVTPSAEADEPPVLPAAKPKFATLQAGSDSPASSPRTSSFPVISPGASGVWRSAGVLSQMGVQPLLVEKVFDRVRAKHGEAPPASFGEELALVRSILASFWRSPPELKAGTPPIHALIGPPGSGKTTVACKWLAKTVLSQGGKAKAWRLDSRSANFAGLLDYYGEILSVPVEREWKGVGTGAGLSVGFIDLPGVSIQDEPALEQLRAQLHAIPEAQVHLVLNGAYDMAVLHSQVRAFEALPISDLILTHVDEERRRGKIWNLVLGTKFTVRFLSGGQNVPGEFEVATPELLIS